MELKIDKCKLFGHKWTPVFIKGEYNGQMIKFIACFCGRCRKGYGEVHEIVGAAKNRQFAEYSEKYFDGNYFLI